jgi:hypothetical protein
VGRYVGGKRKVCVEGMFMLCKVQLWRYGVRRYLWCVLLCAAHLLSEACKAFN